MAHWQALDGTRSSVLATQPAGQHPAPGRAGHHPFPGSMRAMDWDDRVSVAGLVLRHPMGSAPTRATAAPGCGSCSASPGWPCSPAATTARGGQLDDWHPRCDPRIPLAAREPQANYGCSPGADQPSRGCGRRSSGIWAPCWRPARCAGRPSARSGCRACSLRPLADDLIDRPRRRPGRPGRCRGRAGRGVPPVDRQPTTGPPRRPPTTPGATVVPRLVNEDLRAVAELFAFLAANPADARLVLGPSPGQRVTDAHAAGWFRQLSRVRTGPPSTTSTTSTTTLWPRSPPPCRCSVCPATSRC